MFISFKVLVTHTIWLREGLANYILILLGKKKKKKKESMIKHLDKL